MGTPAFATTTVRPATRINASDGQLNFIRDLLSGRKWNDSTLSQAKYVSRCAVLNMVITWAYAPMADETPAEISRIINGVVGRSAPYGSRVNALLDYMAEGGTAAPGYEFAYAPLTKAGASTMIDWLKTLPRETNVRVDERRYETAASTDVPAGRYAVETEDGATNGLAFYKVDRPTEGRWAGYVFVKLMVSDDEQRLSQKASQAVLQKIAAAGPAEASARYGHEIGECGVCGRTLTNDESRAYGIGPDCRKKLGW
ncbi:hypothetical protein SEA_SERENDIPITOUS_45 [Mycobacterium phage Serendipitous]|uniref:Uncharacterized protein n=1 Tax=Mycobacterium phage Serendipitous TaxID=2301619 RepID=A0A385UHE3_9CAUD|nr:hypothetical protein I5G64_gp45 [Mycobacterium phage Serendipitous]AYB70586.1 hypothetical protein SEA_SERENDIPITOUS_45 [Mycobacterium phage Serendipitous]